MPDKAAQQWRGGIPRLVDSDARVDFQDSLHRIPLYLRDDSVMLAGISAPKQGADMLQPTPSSDATPLVRLKVARPRRRCVGSRHYPLSAIGRPVVIEPSVVLELKCRDTNLAV